MTNICIYTYISEVSDIICVVILAQIKIFMCARLCFSLLDFITFLT
jgi:hypothetical protein